MMKYSVVLKILLILNVYVYVCVCVCVFVVYWSSQNNYWCWDDSFGRWIIQQGLSSDGECTAALWTGGDHWMPHQTWEESPTANNMVEQATGMYVCVCLCVCIYVCVCVMLLYAIVQ